MTHGLPVMSATQSDPGLTTASCWADSSRWRWRPRTVPCTGSPVAGADNQTPSSLPELSPALNRPGAVWRTLLQRCPPTR
jgi:hypothetical protein